MRPLPTSRKVEDKVKVEKKHESARRLTLTSTSAFFRCYGRTGPPTRTPVRYFKCKRYSWSTGYGNGWFLRDDCHVPEAAGGSSLQFCTTSASDPRGLPTCLAWPAFFPALLADVRCREISPPVVARFVGGHGDGANRGRTMSLLPSLRWTSLHGLSRAIDRLLGDA